MFRRSKSREVALQLLFQRDINAKPMSEVAVKSFVRERLLADPKAMEFALELWTGCNANRAALDEIITATAENWRLVRMLPSDRNVLRLAAYELLHTEAPIPVILNEAIELARRFGTVDSPSFVNGLLDRIAKRRGAAEAS